MNLSSGTQSIIAGALYDFMGYLTTRPKSMVTGAAETPHDILEHFQTWADERGLSLEKAMVQDWNTQVGEITIASLASGGAVEQRRIAGALLSYVDFLRVAQTSDYEKAMLRWASKTGLTIANPQPRWSLAEWA